MGEWVNKMGYIYTMKYYSAMKKNELFPARELPAPAPKTSMNW